MTQAAFAPAGARTVAASLAAGAAYLSDRGLDAPRLEGEHLLAAVLSCQRTELYLHPEQLLSPDQHRLFFSHLERRAANEPLQYITGCVDFYGLWLSIGPGVFIPRPETELIVEAARNLRPAPRRILDLCTGSGALALALAKQFPRATLLATDCSEDALAVARDNIARHGRGDRLSLLKGDLFDALRNAPAPIEAFDLIVCNPPYISEAERDSLPANVRDHEPALALFAPENGLAFYRRILSEAASFLTEQGRLLLELGAGQAEWLESFVNRTGVFDLHLIDDWAGIQRIARLSRRKA